MIALVDPDPAFCDRITGDLVSLPNAVQRLDTGEIDGVVSASARPSVVLLGPGIAIAEALTVAERVRRDAPDVSIVLVTYDLTADLLQAALRAGVRDVLPYDFSPEQLLETVGHAEEVSRSVRGHNGDDPGDDPGQPGRIITVFSAKGGVGKSFVASNLAVLLAQRHPRVALVDLDLQFGDQAIMLQLFPARTIADAAASMDRLDADAMTGFCTPHRSGVNLLAAPLEPGLAETIQPAATERILRLLKQSFSCVVLDTPALFTEHVLAALDLSDEIVFLTSLDVPSIKNTKLALQTLQMLGVGPERTRLLLNRADSQVGLRVQEVERMLGSTVHVQIPSSREVPLSINQGTPLAFSDPRSSVVATLRPLAESIGRPIPTAPQPERARFRLRRRAS